MMGKAMIGAIVIGAALGFNANDDIDKATQKIEPTKSPSICYHDAHCGPKPPDHYWTPAEPTATVPPDQFLCAEDPYSHDCWVWKQKQWEEPEGPVVLR